MNSDSQPTPADVLDFIGDGCEQIVDMPDGNGKLVPSLVRNHKKIGYKSQNVDSNCYGDFATESENFLLLADEAKYNMSEPMAESLKNAIKARFQAWEYGIDGKSSESLRDGHNARTTLVDKFIRNRQERIVTLKDDARKSIFEGMGLTGDKEDRRD